MTDPPGAAGGARAVRRAFAHALRESGLRRGMGSLLQVDQPDGFACLASAWPREERPRSIATCPNGIRAVANETTRRRVTEAFFARHSIADLWARADAWLNAQGRLTRPVMRTGGDDHYRPVDWDEAFAVIARELGALGSAREAWFYTSGRTSNEAAYLFQLFARQWGCPNLGGSADLCQAPADAALEALLGTEYPTTGLEDLERAEVIVLAGINPGTTQPRMLDAVARAKRRGAAVVGINPIREPGLLRFKGHGFRGGVSIADVLLQGRVGADGWTFIALTRALLERADSLSEAIVDRAFVDANVEGFATWAAAVRSIPWATILANCGLLRAEVEDAAEILARSEATIVCYGNGITQHGHVGSTMRAIVNFLALGGHLGRPGAGLCPVRGHSNAAGVRAVGARSDVEPTYLEAIGREFGFVPPRATGWTSPAALRALVGGSVRAFVGLGGNPVSASPDRDRVARSLRACRLTVHVATKLNRSHLAAGKISLVLPCLGRTELDVQPRGQQFVSVVDTTGGVRPSRGHLSPVSDQVRSEVRIVSEMAARVLGEGSPVAWSELADDYDRIREHIERTVPGFGQYNHRVRKPGGFSLRGSDGGGSGVPSLALVMEEPPAATEHDGTLMLTSIRAQGQRCTTIYDQDDPDRGVAGSRAVVFMNREDMLTYAVAPGERVTLVRDTADGVRRLPGLTVVSHPIARGCVATYFPEANALVGLDGSGPAPLKGVPVKIRVP